MRIVKEDQGSATEQIIRGYYKTTAQRGHRDSVEHYDRAARGLELRLKPWLPRDLDSECLDLACGCGELVYLLEKRGFQRVRGVDSCAEELERARPFVSKRLIDADALEYLTKCPPQSFDFITALNFLEHLSKEKLLETLREIRRVLRPGGTLVAMVPNAVSPFGGLTRHWDITHEWAFTPNNFRQLAALLNFDPEVDFRECGPVPHGVISGIRYGLWQALRAGIATWFFIEVADSKGGVYTMDMLVRLRAP